MSSERSDAKKAFEFRRTLHVLYDALLLPVKIFQLLYHITYKHLIYTCMFGFNNSTLIHFLHVTGDHLYDNWTSLTDLSTKDSKSLVKMKKTFTMTEESISLPSSLLAAQNMKEVPAKSCHLVCQDPEETTT